MRGQANLQSPLFYAALEEGIRILLPLYSLRMRIHSVHAPKRTELDAIDARLERSSAPPNLLLNQDSATAGPALDSSYESTGRKPRLDHAVSLVHRPDTPRTNRPRSQRIPAYRIDLYPTTVKLH